MGSNAKFEVERLDEMYKFDMWHCEVLMILKFHYICTLYLDHYQISNNNTQYTNKFVI